MRKTPKKFGESVKLGGAIVGPFLLAYLLFLLFSPVLCHAQECPSTPYISMNPTTWYPGANNVILTYNWGSVPPYNCILDTIVVLGSGVTISNVSPVVGTQSTFTATVAASAPTGGDIVQVYLGEFTVLTWYVTISPAPPPLPPCSASAARKPGVAAAPECAPPPPPVCPAPILTAVTPDIWFAGKIYGKVTLTGSGFTNTTACPAPPVYITDANGNAVPYSNATVTPAGTIVVTAVAPPASDPTETACVTLGNPNVALGAVPARPIALASAAATPAPGTAGSACTIGNATGITVQILGPPTIQCSGPNMQCNGQTISVTDDGSGTAPTAQNAVVGQQILLNTTPATTDLAALGLAFSKNTWTAGPTTGGTNNVGGYTMTATRTKITQTDLKKADLTTYWLYPNSNNPATYLYCVNIPGLSAADVKNGLNCSLPADAVFNSVGPTANIVPNPTTWHVSPPIPVCKSTVKEQMLSFGTYNPATSTTCKPVVTTSGMTFDATVNLSPGNSGQTEWDQVLGPDNTTTGTGLGGQPIPSTNQIGLDNTLPYNDNPIPVDAISTETSDSPGIGLDINWDKATKLFDAKMYLMWTSQIPGSITVPLGYVQWSISGTATAQDGRTPLWSLSSSGPTSKQFHVSTDDGTKSHGLPTYSHLVTNSTGATSAEDGTDENEEEQQ